MLRNKTHQYVLVIHRITHLPSSCWMVNDNHRNFYRSSQQRYPVINEFDLVSVRQYCINSVLLLAIGLWSLLISTPPSFSSPFLCMSHLCVFPYASLLERNLMSLFFPVCLQVLVLPTSNDYFQHDNCVTNYVTNRDISPWCYATWQ